MQTKDFENYRLQDEWVARNNLAKMISDPNGLGGANSGWCYIATPLRSYLTNPVFIRWLRKFKEKYYINNTIKLNKEFLSHMYGQNFPKRKDCQMAFIILTSLCKHTDSNGEIKEATDERNMRYTDIDKKGNTTQKTSPYGGLMRLMHYLCTQYKKSSIQDIAVYFEDCLAIMSESTNILQLFVEKVPTTFRNLPPKFKTEIEQQLNSGQCVTAGAGGYHAFNIYKSHDGHYYVLGGNSKINRIRYNSIDNALWAFRPKPGKFHSIFSMQSKKISENQDFASQQKEKQKGIEEYYRKKILQNMNNQFQFQNNNQHAQRIMHPNPFINQQINLNKLKIIKNQNNRLNMNNMLFNRNNQMRSPIWPQQNNQFMNQQIINQLRIMNNPNNQRKIFW